MVVGNELGILSLEMSGIGKTSQISLPRAILFDHDGTLVASEPLHWAAWGSLLVELEIPYVEADLQKMVGMTAPEIMTVLLDRYKPGWVAPDYDVHQLAQRKNDHYLKHAELKPRHLAFARFEIEFCHSKGIKIAVVSNAKGRELKAALGWLGILDEFDLIISRDEARAPKPDPARATQWPQALLELGIHECLAVEDSPTGIEASLLAQIPSAAVLTNFKREDMEHPVQQAVKPIWISDSIEALFRDLQAI